jgi:hypothetical protein
MKDKTKSTIFSHPSSSTFPSPRNDENATKNKAKHNLAKTKTQIDIIDDLSSELSMPS